MINVILQHQESIDLGRDPRTLADRRTKDCIYCDTSVSHHCGVKHLIKTMLRCTRPVSHNGMHAACAPEKHPLEVW